MSKKYRNFDYNRNNQFNNNDSEEKMDREESTDDVIEEQENTLTEENNTEIEHDMLLDKEEVERVLQDKIENLIEPKKENSEEVSVSLVREEPEEFVVNMNDFVSTSLLTYYENMNNTIPINPENAAKWNYSLFNVFKEILNKPLEEFKKDWNTVLKFFHQYKDTCFRHELMYRAPQYWPGSEKEYEMYRVLVFIAIETADVNTRNSAIKEMRNFENKLNIFTEDQRNKLISFYF